MSRLCLVLLLLCCALPARAQPPAPLDGEDLRLSLGAYAELTTRCWTTSRSTC